MAWDFSSLQLGNILGLSLLGLIPLLVLAYLKRRSERLQMVSSVLLLKTLPKHPIRKRRFKPPLRFFLEALSLLLLAIAAAVPIFKEGGERVAVVLDNSMSMSALVSNSETRFQKAIVDLSKWLDEKNSSNLYTLFTAAPSMTVVGDKDVSASKLLAAIKDIKPNLTPDSLQSPLEQLAKDGEYDRILIVTDKSLTHSADSALSETKSFRTATTKLEAITAAQVATNVYFTAARLEQSKVSANEAKILVSIASSSNAPQQVQLKLFGFANAQSASTDEEASGKNIATKDVTVNPAAPLEVTFSLPANVVSAFSYFKATLQTSAGKVDALVADNAVWLSKSSDFTTAVLLISPDTTPLGLTSENGFNAKQVSPAEYNALGDDELKTYSLLVFHKSAPASAPRVSSLLILPPANNPLFTVVSQFRNPSISSWAETHPLTAYLRVPLLNPQAAQVFTLPLWAQAIVNTEEGPLVVAGESQGVRFAAVGFELLPFEGLKTPALSVLTLNLVNWLLGQEQLQGSLLTGGALRLSSEREWSVIDPAGTSTTLAGDGNTPVFLQLTAAGIYRLQQSGSNTGKLLAVNVIHPEESSTFITSTIELPAEFPKTSSDSVAANPFWPLLVALVLLILVIEIALRLKSAGNPQLGAQPQ